MTAPMIDSLRAALAASTALWLVSYAAAAEPPPAETPPPAPAPSALAPPPAPGASEGPPPASAAAAEPPAPRVAPTPEAPQKLELSLGLGAASRVDDEQTYELTERTGLALRAGLLAMPGRWWGVGLAYEHVDLGHARSAALPSALEIDRDLSTLWASVRIYIARSDDDDAGLYLSLGPGLTWQSADASGAELTGPFASSAVGVTCEGSDSADLALTAGLGAEKTIAGALSVALGASFDGYRMSTLPLDDCALGAGSASTLTVRGGFAYKFDVSRYVR